MLYNPKLKLPYGSIPDYQHPLVPKAGWWMLNEPGGNTAHDLSRNGNHGTLTNGPTWQGGALAFDGNDDSLQLASSPDVLGLSEATWIIWAKPDAITVTTDGCLLNDYSDDARHRPLIWFDAGNDKWQALVDDVEGDRILVQENGNAQPSGEWEQIAVVLYQQSLTIYVDGIMSGTNSNGSFGVLPLSSGNCWLGLTPASTRPFDGLLSEVHIYPRALSIAEIEVRRINSLTGEYAEFPRLDVRYFLPPVSAAYRQRIIGIF